MPNLTPEDQDHAADYDDTIEFEPMPLRERLSRCKSRAAARTSIADFCEENEISSKDYHLDAECLEIFDKLK